MLSHFSHVQLFATLWKIARQAPLSMGFSRQEYWSGLSCPPPEDLPDSGIESTSLMSPACQAGSLSLAPPGKPILALQRPHVQADSEEIASCLTPSFNARGPFASSVLLTPQPGTF